MPQDQLRRLLANYLELEQAQIIRQLLVVRCGLLAAVAFLLAVTTHALSTSAWTAMIALLLARPSGAWIVELRRQWRLATRLHSTANCTPLPGPMRKS